MSCVAGQDIVIRGLPSVPGREGSMRGVMPVLEDTRFGWRILATFIIVTLFLAMTPPPPVLSAPYEVTSTADTGPGTLREAIGLANALPGADTISFNLSAPGPITLTSEIPITDDLTITGPGAATLTVSGGGASRVFSISNSAKVHISGLTIADGFSGNGSNGNPADDGGDGGGILAGTGSELTLTNCVLEYNATGDGGDSSTMGGVAGDGGNGGAIWCEGSVTLSGCTLHHNHTGSGGYSYSGIAGSGGDGGAILCWGTLSLSECTLNDNHTGDGEESHGYPGNGGNGGAISWQGTLTLDGCTLEDNYTGVGGLSDLSGMATGNGGNGGAIAGEGPVTLGVCTLDGNHTGAGGEANSPRSGGNGGNGGALWASEPPAPLGTLTLSSCTFESNYTGDGGQAIHDGGNGGDGGAVWSDKSVLSIASCDFNDNYAGTGGVSDDSNDACGNGGNGGGCSLSCTTGAISDSTFSNNHAGDGPDGEPGDSGDGGGGGALFLDMGEFTLTGCVLDGNRGGDGGEVSTGSAYGGRGGHGGGLAALEDTSLELRDCTLSNNMAGDAGSHQTSTYGRSGGRGGGLYSDGPTLIESCLVSGNRAGNGGSTPAAGGGRGGYGGGIYGGEGAELTVLRTTIEGNYAGNGGGGSFSQWGGDGGGGGGLSCKQALTMDACTVSGNYVGTAGFPYAVDGLGGGIGIFGEPDPDSLFATLVNCTISGNYGPSTSSWDMDSGGGGLYITFLRSLLSNCTISDNTAVCGGGVMVCPAYGGTDAPEPGQPSEVLPTLLLKNCIVAGNDSDMASDIFDRAWDRDGIAGGVVSHGCNLVGDDEGFSLVYDSGAPDDIIGADPMLEALGNNGGPTETMALQSGSPAIDGVEEGHCRTIDGDPVDEDQRGETRPMNGDRDGTVLCDIGAYEAPGPLEAVLEAEPEEAEKRPPLPASMSACYMALGAYQALPGQAVQVSVNVCNGGELKGTQSVVLSVNGSAEQSQTVSVSGGSCKTVVFTVAKSVPGTYDIDVNGMHGQFTVLAPRLVQGTVPSQQDSGLGTAGIIAIMAVMVVLVIGLVVVFRQS